MESAPTFRRGGGWGGDSLIISFSHIPGTSVTNWTVTMDAIEGGGQFGTKTLLQIVISSGD